MCPIQPYFGLSGRNENDIIAEEIFFSYFIFNDWPGIQIRTLCLKPTHKLFTLWFIDEDASFVYFFHKITNIQSWRCFSSSKICTQFLRTFCNIIIIFKGNVAIFPSVVQAYTQPASLGGRIQLIICQIRLELSVTIHEISTGWKKNVGWRTL